MPWPGFLQELDPRNYDSSGMGPGLDVVEETRNCMNQDLSLNEELNEREMEVGDDRVRNVRHMSLTIFRRLLVNPFAILFSQNKLYGQAEIELKEDGY